MYLYFVCYQKYARPYYTVVYIFKTLKMFKCILSHRYKYKYKNASFDNFIFVIFIFIHVLL